MPQSSATLGRAIKTEPRCKICNSPHRGEIEDLLAIRSDGGSIRLPDGSEQRVTEQWLQSVAPERWGWRLNKQNIHLHYSKHFQKGDPAVLPAVNQQDAVNDLVARIQGGELAIKSPEELLDLIITLGFERASFDPKAVTLDHALKAVAEKTKRKTNEGQAELLNTLGRAVEESVRRIPAPAPSAPVDGTPPAEIVEAEVVEVDA